MQVLERTDYDSGSCLLPDFALAHMCFVRPTISIGVRPPRVNSYFTEHTLTQVTPSLAEQCAKPNRIELAKTDETPTPSAQECATRALVGILRIDEAGDALGHRGLKSIPRQSSAVVSAGGRGRLGPLDFVHHPNRGLARRRTHTNLTLE